MIGPRRFGKTSLINAVTQKRRKKGDIILAYNAESFSYIEDLIAEIIKDSAEMLKGSNQKKVDKLHVFFKSLRPEISFSFTPNRLESGPRRKSTVERFEPNQTLPRSSKRPRKARRRSETRCQNRPRHR